MRINGTLTKWNEDRGFGFISPADGGPEIFVHVSAFPKDGQRPKIGERLTFEIESTEHAKQRATHLVCLDRQVRETGRKPAPSYRRRKRTAFERIVQVAVVAALIGCYVAYSRRTAPRAAVAAQSSEQAVSSVFKCDGRTLCQQMTSCSEATFFLKNCPDVKMDGNHDGTPCEQQWCGK